MAPPPVCGSVQTSSSCVVICFQVPARSFRITSDSWTGDNEQWIFESRLHVDSSPEYADFPSGNWLFRIRLTCDLPSGGRIIHFSGSTEIVPPENVTASRTGDLAYFTVRGENVRDKGSVAWSTDNKGIGMWRTAAEGIQPQILSRADISQIRNNHCAWTYIITSETVIEVELLIPVPPNKWMILEPSAPLHTRLWAGFSSQLHADCTLVCRDGKEFPAQRFILASASSVFRAMFEHDMQEKRNGICQIDDMDGNIMEVLLEFFYTDRADRERIKDVVEEVYTAADKYDVGALRVACENLMVDNLSAKTALSYLNFAVARGLDGLKLRAINFLHDKSESFPLDLAFAQFTPLFEQKTGCAVKRFGMVCFVSRCTYSTLHSLLTWS